VEAVAYGDVEHFRPKAGYQQRDGGPLVRPGYYWLVYEWTNLLFCCQICNQQHKRNLFPVAARSPRAATHRDDVLAEKPLLIDPSRDEPEPLLGFREEVAYPRKNALRGKTTIDVLGLNRPALLEKRRDRLAPVKALLDSQQLLVRKLANPTARARAAKVEQLAKIERCLAGLIQSHAEFASMFRSLLGGRGK
jgi:hypothetical protein